MKMNGKRVDVTYIETVVIPRGAIDYVFKARPLTKEDDDSFAELYPKPEVPMVTKPGGVVEADTGNQEYIAAFKVWSDAKATHLFVASLSATEWLEWETVDVEDPKTWDNIEEELLEAGFLNPEIVRILNICITANGLDTSKIDKATKSFLAGQAVVGE